MWYPDDIDIEILENKIDGLKFRYKGITISIQKDSRSFDILYEVSFSDEVDNYFISEDSDKEFWLVLRLILSIKVSC